MATSVPILAYGVAKDTTNSYISFRTTQTMNPSNPFDFLLDAYCTVLFFLLPNCRDNSQYCYKNLQTNETRWEFPCETPVIEQKVETANSNEKVEKPVVAAHDDDAMDISTTPPPPPSPPQMAGNDWTWDPGNSAIQMDASRPADISGELASFYSDIASIDPAASNILQNDNELCADKSKGDEKVSLDEVSQSTKRGKKRKKVKVPGLGSKMQEVSTMVANWQKAQKELGN